MLLGNQADRFSNDTSLASFALRQMAATTGSPAARGRDILGGGARAGRARRGTGRDTVAVIDCPKSSAGPATARRMARCSTAARCRPGPRRPGELTSCEAATATTPCAATRGDDQHRGWRWATTSSPDSTATTSSRARAANDLALRRRGRRPARRRRGQRPRWAAARGWMPTASAAAVQTRQVVETGDDVLDGGGGDDTLIAGPGRGALRLHRPLGGRAARRARSDAAVGGAQRRRHPPRRPGRRQGHVLQPRTPGRS